MSEIDLTAVIRARFEFKALKTWTGNEGTAFQANLYFEGKKVAQVTDDGWGGELRIDWAGLRYNGTIHTPSKAATHAAKAKAKLDEIVAATPAVEFHGSTIKVDAGWLLNELVDFMLLAKACKKQTCFRRPTDGKGSYTSINRPFSPSMKAYVEKNYPGATIINEEVNAVLAA